MIDPRMKLLGASPLSMEACDYIEEAYAVLSLVALNLEDERAEPATHTILAGATRGAQTLMALAFKVSQ